MAPHHPVLDRCAAGTRPRPGSDLPTRLAPGPTRLVRAYHHALSDYCIWLHHGTDAVQCQCNGSSGALLLSDPLVGIQIVYRNTHSRKSGKPSVLEATSAAPVVVRACACDSHRAA